MGKISDGAATKAAKKMKSYQVKPMTYGAFLTEKEKAFIDHYMVTLSPLEALKLAGYTVTDRRGPNIARTIMSRPHVARVIENQMAAARKKLQITQDELLEHLGKVVRAPGSHFYRIDEEGQPIIDWSKSTEEDLDLIAEVSNETVIDGEGNKLKKVRVKTIPKQPAVDALARIYGMNKDRIEVVMPQDEFIEVAVAALFEALASVGQSQAYEACITAFKALLSQKVSLISTARSALLTG